MMKILGTQLLENVGRLVFYKDGKKVVIESHQSGNDVFKFNDKNEFVIDYMQKVISMDAGKEFKRAVKENLNRKDNYYMTYLPQYSSFKRLALYVYADFETKEVIDHIWDRETAYINAVTVKLPFIYEVTTREELPYDPDFRLPEGAAWYSENRYNGPDTYKVIDLDSDSLGYKRRKESGLPTKYINHLTSEKVEKASHTFKVGPYTRIEYSKNFQKCIDIAEDFENILGKHISRYDIEKLLAHYEIKRKEA